MNPHQVTREFEMAVAAYCGAPFAVSTTSCTMAIQMALAWRRFTGKDCGYVEIPRFTYVGVAASVLNAGFELKFRDEEWSGDYSLSPGPVVDSARRFTSKMYTRGEFRCVSFHWAKTLAISQGGMVLHDDPEADSWMRRYRFDGRTEGVDPKDDQVLYPSVHAYMSPEVAAHGIMKLSLLPKHNADLPRSDYPDLSKMKAFQ